MKQIGTVLSNGQWLCKGATCDAMSIVSFCSVAIVHVDETACEMKVGVVYYAF